MYYFYLIAHESTFNLGHEKPVKTPENRVIFALKNSQDFNGFQFPCVIWLLWEVWVKVG